MWDIKVETLSQLTTLFERRHPGKGFPADLIRPARRKLVMLNRAKALNDLLSPPGNRLEALRHDSRRFASRKRLRAVQHGSAVPRCRSPPGPAREHL